MFFYHIEREAHLYTTQLKGGNTSIVVPEHKKSAKACFEIVEQHELWEVNMVDEQSGALDAIASINGLFTLGWIATPGLPFKVH